ncbi:MAG: hypothetical protein HOW71_04360 [Nonomuraea sp.]|nr:hypothetical protein [Nonomuraea sp.]
MDVEAELLDIKLRIMMLEAALCPERAGKLGLTELKADIVELRDQMSRNVAALGGEPAAFHGRNDEHDETVRTSVTRRLDLLRCETLELAVRLDRLLEKDGA